MGIDWHSFKGGMKHKWLCEHRDLVLSFFEEFGEKATCDRFNLLPGTLYRLTVGEKWSYRPPLPRKDDRALLKSEIAISKAERVESVIYRQRSEEEVTVTITCKLPGNRVKQLLSDILADGGE